MLLVARWFFLTSILLGRSAEIKLLSADEQVLTLIPALLALTCDMSAQTVAIEVHVYDQAGLQPSILQEFVTHTQKILAETGLSIQVKACGRNVSLFCESQLRGTRYLDVRVVAVGPKKVKNVRRPPLGQSFTNGDGGKYASVFLQPLQDEAASADVPWIIVLAYATAHEIGHLLLGNEAHTPHGVMKATWDRTDYEAMNQNYLHFSAEQIRQLKRRYGNAGTAVVCPEPLKVAVKVGHE